ncbi:hypothetical protein PybrP1_012326 [[Pythium] brassicae (nom. inval.)]|nr:hypothetical protein PybrP1_012326 [[Pythium] brassicae (nom. inval.)]
MATIPEALVAQLRAKKQEHVLKFYEAGKLRDDQVAQLRAQLEELDLDFLQSIFEASTRADGEHEQAALEPLEQFDLLETCAPADRAAWHARGLKAISCGHVAAIVLAGGQGTRLGFAGPKGMFRLELPSAKSLFQLFAERLRRLETLADAAFPTGAGAVVPFFVMTSPMNHDETVAYFARHAFFGLREAQVFFFRQGTLPCFTTTGKLMLENAHTLATASDGNGSLYKALATSGALARLQTSGVQFLHVFSVDNALCKPADPTFIGYCVAKRADCANKVVWKSRASERVGVVARKSGRFCVVEYSEMDAAACELVNPATGRLAFGAANICNHFYTMDFLTQVVLPNLSLTYHVAHKQIPIADDAGETFTPATNSGVKLESFIFDVFPLSTRMAVLAVPRETEFAPVKNPSGSPVDSPESALAMLQSEAKTWLAAAARRALSEADASAFIRDTLEAASAVEVSPLASYNGEGLEAHVLALSGCTSASVTAQEVIRIEPESLSATA